MALSSRPINRLGRIWADGKLLRGAAGDLKVGGSLRVHLGHADQLPDPLIAAAEGPDAPAWRGLAYVVFEDLQLTEYGNRIPALSFEIIADEGPLELQNLLDPLLPGCDAAIALSDLEGLSVDGSAADLLAVLDPLFPLDCDACDERLQLRPAERGLGTPRALPEAALPTAREDFGSRAGFARQRTLAGPAAPRALRYYDPERDYQPGVQRAGARPVPGAARMLELPATIAAPAARRLIEAAARRETWARHSMAWRVSQLDPQIGPGSVVTVPGEPGFWRVRVWEWRESGVELKLERIVPQLSVPASPIDPGRTSRDPDLPLAATALLAFELPWDGNPATPLPQLCAAAGPALDAGPGVWNGASLFADGGDGALRPLGASGRTAAITGRVAGRLQPASPLLLDRASVIEVELGSADALLDAAPRQLAQGANRALVGEEIVQFASAMPQGAGRWRLAGLLRGRGGTEGAVFNHSAGEGFVLLDGPLTSLDPALVGPADLATIGAVGLGDGAPVFSPVRLAGIGWRPLSPVHGTASSAHDGGLRLGWTRRARGAWQWDDGAGTPLNEQREAYSAAFVAAGVSLARWTCTEPQLLLTGSDWGPLAAAAPAGVFQISQLGDRGQSAPLIIRPA